MYIYNTSTHTYLHFLHTPVSAQPINQYWLRVCDMTRSYPLYSSPSSLMRGYGALWHRYRALLRRNIGLFCSDIGLFGRDAGLFCSDIGLFGGDAGLFCRDIGLFCRDIGLFCGDAGDEPQSQHTYTHLFALFAHACERAANQSVEGIPLYINQYVTSPLLLTLVSNARIRGALAQI